MPIDLAPIPAFPLGAEADGWLTIG